MKSSRGNTKPYKMFRIVGQIKNTGKGVRETIKSFGIWLILEQDHVM